MSDLSFAELFEPGALGDTVIELRLTAREVAALHFAVAAGGEELMALSYLSAESVGLGDRWSVALRSGLMRVGIAIARALRPERADDLYAALARIDQDKTALDENGGTNGD